MNTQPEKDNATDLLKYSLATIGKIKAYNESKRLAAQHAESLSRIISTAAGWFPPRNPNGTGHTDKDTEL